MRTADRWIAVICLILCGTLYVLTLSFPPRPATFPRVLIMALALMSIILLGSSFKRGRAQTPPKDIITKEVLITTTLIFLSTILIPVLGYFTTTALFLFFLMWVLNPTKKALYVAISAGTTVLMYVAFAVFLKIWLPRGLLF